MDLNKKLKELKPQQLNCNVFDVYSYNGLTMQDLLCQFFTTINECVKSTNEVIDLTDWMVNVGLEEEVVKKLMGLIKDGTVEKLINVNLFDSLNDEINVLSSQLEHKANDDEVVKKGYGTLNDFDETTRAMIQGIEQGNINAVLGYKNVIPFNTSFFKTGANMFNKNTTTDNAYVIDSNGNLQTSSSTNFFASDYIDIEGLSTIKSNGLIWHYAFYNVNKDYISGSSVKTKTISIPQNAKWLRFSVYELDNKNMLMLYNGDMNISDYEPYYEYIPLKYTEANYFTIDDVKDLPLSKMDFSKQTSNLFNKNTIETDRYIDTSTGKLVSTIGFITSDYIEVKSLTNYIIKSLRHIACYDENKRFIKGESSVSSNYRITTPSNCKYIRISFYPPADGISIVNQQVNEGDILLPFEEYGYYIPLEYIENKNSNENSNEKELQINLPKTLYCTPNNEIRINFQSVFTDYYKGIYDIKIKCAKGKQYKNEWTYIPTKTENFPLTFSIYKNNKILISKTINIQVASEISKTLTGLFLGDSTTAHGFYTKNFKVICNNSNISVNFLGTRVSGETNNEGRSGWTAKQYCTIASSDSYDNPFYNPSSKTFDFSYYMTQQGYNNLDFINIHLGINDIFQGQNSEDTLSYINTIVDSIKEYNSNIKILLNIVIPPNPSQDAWGNAYGCSKALWEYYRDYNNFLKIFIDTYSNKESENIYLIGINSVWGNEEDFQDAVHGKYENGVGGYQKMAEQSYYAINAIYK